MQTKVRIVGEQELGKKIAKVIEEHFEIKKREKFGTVPYRYATKMPLGCSIYVTVKKEKPLKTSDHIEIRLDKPVKLEPGILYFAGPAGIFEAPAP